MNTVLLTGGTGFFGKSIMDYFLRYECRSHFVVLSRHPDRFLSQNPQFATIKSFSFVQGDIRDFQIPDSISIDRIIHAATPADNTTRDDEMRSIIVDGTAHVLDIARLKQVKRILYISSGAVYGKQPDNVERIPETLECKPVTAYGKGKLEAETMCLRSGIETVIARCFAFIGKYLPKSKHYAIGNFMDDCLHERPITIQGDGTAMRSYLYADDLVEWLLALLEHGNIGQAYNVGSDKAYSIREIAEHVKSALNSKTNIEILGKPQQFGKVSRYIPDVSKIIMDLGVTESFSFDEMIRQSM